MQQAAQRPKQETDGEQTGEQTGTDSLPFVKGNEMKSCDESGA